MTPYYTAQGDQVSQQEIEQAVKERRAILSWSHGNWENIAALYIYPTSEEAEDMAERDTRGKCYSMADEVWCELATDMRDARRAAAGNLRYG